MEAIKQAVEEARVLGTGSWIDLFRGTHFRRSMVGGLWFSSTLACLTGSYQIAAWLFIFQQITGQQFYNSYGPTFYTQFGLGTKSFTYQTISFAMVCVATFMTMLVLDKIGRRNILIVGCFSQMLFMLVAAGLGTKSNKTDGDINGVVASLILFYVSEKVSLSVNAYVIGAEVGGTGLRKKSGCLSSSTCDKHLLQMQPCPLLPLWTLLLLLWSPSACPTC